MQVAKLMQRQVATARATDRLDTAAARLRELDCGSVVVVDEHRRPVAMLTDRDICLAALRCEQRLAERTVETAMSKRLFTCRGDDTIAAAEATMSLHQVRRLPVVDAHGRLQGLLALDDIAREACREADLLAPPVSCAAVGRTLGQIARPRLLAGGEAEAGGEP
jgi:CBS domain-containing protein